VEAKNVWTKVLEETGSTLYIPSRSIHVPALEIFVITITITLSTALLTACSGLNTNIQKCLPYILLPVDVS
jgi:hypothetical protein